MNVSMMAPSLVPSADITHSRMPHPDLAHLASWFAPRIRFDRNELAGSFGDIGTSLPLIAGIILASGADSASILICFGLLQITTAFLYGIPMPVQPLKAVAVLVIAQLLTRVAGPVGHRPVGYFSPAGT